MIQRNEQERCTGKNTPTSMQPTNSSIIPNLEPFFSRLRQFSKMLIPDPADLFIGIILIPRQPQLPSLGNHVEDLAGYVGKVWEASFSSRAVDIEFVDGCGKEEDVDSAV